MCGFFVVVGYFYGVDEGVYYCYGYFYYEVVVVVEVGVGLIGVDWGCGYVCVF